MRAEEFDARYQDGADPWGYRSSAYEQAKYAATLAACGPGPFACALELAGSIGVFSALLAPRCRQLTTIDFSPAAVRQAREALVDLPQVTVLAGAIPADLPDLICNLVVASEILYYLDPAALEATLEALETRIAPGGRLVAVHWRREGPERPFSAAQVHARLHALDWLTPVADHATEAYRLDVFERPRVDQPT